MSSELGGKDKDVNIPTPNSQLLTPALFGIVQGGRHEDLRRESARAIET